MSLSQGFTEDASGNTVVSGTVSANQGGTWTVQPGNTANTTAWKVDGSAVTQPVSGTITANAGTGTFGTQDAATGLTAATAPTKAILGGGVFNTSPATITSGQMGQLQLDATQNMLVKVNVALPVGTNVIGKVSIDQTTPGTTNLVQVGGSLPTGSNTIGNVGIVAGSAVIGHVIVDSGSISTTLPTSATGTLTSVTASATSVTMLASNVSRKGFSVYNDSTSVAYVAFTSSAASATAYTVKLQPNSYYENNSAVYTGAITMIWASANGAARVTELT